MFSIITANYNGKKYLEEAVKSIEAQSFKSWELIIFDDGSTDGSISIAQEFAARNPKIKVFKHADNKNLGLAKTLQKALSLSKGKYIAFLENDDYWDKNYLEEKIKVLNKDENLIVINKPCFFGDKKRTKKLSLYYKLIYLYCGIVNLFKQPWDLNKVFLTFNPVCSFSTLCAKREFFEKLNFDAPFAPWLDRWFLLQLSFKYKFYFINKELTFWRLSQTSWTMKSLKDKAKGSKRFKKEALKLYKKNLSKFQYVSLVLCNTLVSLIVKALKFILGKIFKFS